MVLDFQVFSYIHYWVEYLYLLDIFVYNQIGCHFVTFIRLHNCRKHEASVSVDLRSVEMMSGACVNKTI